MNMAELTRQLREEIEKQYGVGVSLTINFHVEDNPHINRVVAYQLGLAMAHTYGGKSEVVVHEDSDFVVVRLDYKERSNIFLNYQ